jgi:RhtB (resistance to homoserine/threonine) family protein
VTSAVASFFFVALLITIAPGPDSALVLRASIARGRRYGIVSATGVSLGLLLWATASALGVSALLTASTLAYDVLRLAGAAYLCWLGVQAIRAARATRPRDDDEAAPVQQRGLAAAFRTGLLSNLLNPKIGVFYITVLPQFVPRGVSVLAASLLLALVHVAIGMAWLTLVAWAADRAKTLLRKDSARRAIESVTGVVLIGFGLRTALAHR